MKRTLFISLLLLACACASPEDKLQTVKVDDLSNEIIITGQTDHDAQSGAEWTLKTFVDKDTATPHHQLYITVKYAGSSRKIFNHAADETRKRIKLNHILKNGKPCINAKCAMGEVMAIDLTTADLAAHASGGYRITITATDKTAITVPVSALSVKTQIAAAGKYTAIQKK